MSSAAAETTWEIDWLWSLPLIVMCVVIHVVGLMLIYREVIRIMSIAVTVLQFLDHISPSRLRASDTVSQEKTPCARARL